MKNFTKYLFTNSTIIRVARVKRGRENEINELSEKTISIIVLLASYIMAFMLVSSFITLIIYSIIGKMDDYPQYLFQIMTLSIGYFGGAIVAYIKK